MNQNTDRPMLALNPLVLLALGILVTLALGRLAPLPFPAQLPAGILGAVLFFGGLLFGLPAFLGMRRAGTSPNPARPSTSLVEGGAYRVTRNPMYLGMLIAFTGLFIYLRDTWFILALPVLVWLLTVWVVIPEERYLEGRFGQAYKQFAARRPRWI